VLAGCARSAPDQGPTPVEEPPTETRREVIRGGASLAGIVEYHPTANRARVIEFRATPAALWPRVIAAYQAVGIPLGEVDTQAWTLGTNSVRVIGRLGGTRISDYLDCGPGPLGSRAADTYVVTFRATTELKPATAGTAPYTTVRSLVAGVAKANATQGDPVDCVSTGRLETRLVRLIDPAAPTSPATSRR
jgi:hypothetical protein